MNDSPFRWIILAGCWSLYFVFGLSVAGLAPLVGAIQSELGINSSAMGTILGAWQFVYIFLAIPVGFALQRFGAGRLLIFGGAIIALSGLARSQSDGYGMLLFSVALFGLGGPIISAGIPQTVSAWFAEKERGFAMGVYITGPAVAGVLVYSSTQSIFMPLFDDDWRRVLMVWAAAAGIATLLWAGIVFLARGAERSGSGTDANDKGPESSMSVIKLLLRERNVVLLLAIGVGVLMVDHGMRNWLPEIIRSAGWSATEAGYFAVIPVALGIVGALSFPRLATRQRRLGILRALFGLAAAGCVFISLGPVFALVLGLVCLGLASGAMMTVTLLSLIEQRTVGPRNAGMAGGMFFSAAEVGGVTGPVVIGLTHDLTGSFLPAIWLLAGLLGVLVVMTFLVRQEA